MIRIYSVLKQVLNGVVTFFKTDSEIITCDREDITCDID
jgi:hypothetical protein